MGKIRNKMHHLPQFLHKWTSVNGVRDISLNYNTLIITFSWGLIILDIPALNVAYLYFIIIRGSFFFNFLSVVVVVVAF